MKVAQDRQESYANRRRRKLDFQVGEKVFLKVANEGNEEVRNAGEA